MLARVVMGLFVGIGLVGAVVDAVRSVGGELTMLSPAEEAAVVAAQPFTTTDCVFVGTCPTWAGPPQFGSPCTGTGFCSSPYCRDSSASYSCSAPFPTWNPFDLLCVMTGSFPCESDILTCNTAGFCVDRGNGQGPNPTKCGTRTTCIN